MPGTAAGHGVRPAVGEENELAVRVRMFAALRDAAGTGDTTVPPGPLPTLLAELRGRYGQTFAERLLLCSVLLDGSAVARDSDVAVPDGSEIALLPPVSGGGSDGRRR